MLRYLTSEATLRIRRAWEKNWTRVVMTQTIFLGLRLLAFLQSQLVATHAPMDRHTFPDTLRRPSS